MKAPMMLGMRDDNKRTALICACCVSGNAECASVLLAAGADVNAEDGHGVRPLHLAAMQGDSDLTTALLKTKRQGNSGGDAIDIVVDATDSQGRTALICATMEGHAEVAKLLVEEGAADLSITDGTGATALEWAVDLEHFDIVKILQAGRSGDNRDTLASAEEGP